MSAHTNAATDALLAEIHTAEARANVLANTASELRRQAEAADVEAKSVWQQVYTLRQHAAGLVSGAPRYMFGVAGSTILPRCGRTVLSETMEPGPIGRHFSGVIHDDPIR